jgi:hypothetical protein
MTEASSSESKKTCAGPIHFADQGIEVCTTCGGCICCDFEHVDHTRAEYECFTDSEGLCHLKVHDGRACKTRVASSIKEKP